MKKGIIWSIGVLMLISFCVVDGHAQRGKKKKRQSEVDAYFDESGNFAHRLWYGGGVNLGFSGSGNFNVFQLGVSPMVGIRVFEKDDNFSIGPRIGLDYAYYKGLGTDNQTHSVQLLSYSVGAFARYKLGPNFFPHIEFETQSLESVFTTGSFFIVDNEGDVQTIRENRQNFYLGLGYNSSMGVWGYEVLLLYNTLEPDDSLTLPFDIRVGLTYKF